MTGKHRTESHYGSRCQWWRDIQYPSWFHTFFHRPRHRGIYDPLIGTTLGLGHIGNMYIRIIPYMTGFADDLKQELRDMVTMRIPDWFAPGDYFSSNIGTDPDAQWAVWRE